jgi:ATP-dependent Lhr-like helicase
VAEQNLLSALEAFSPATRDWFGRAFEQPTQAQAQAWPAIASGEHVLISAPTGSGKTLAAFMWAIDRLASERGSAGETAKGISLVYVSPLKALSYDIDRNLRVPLRGIGAELSVSVRSGDTPQRERQQMLRTPPDILITTPESLYLMLTGQAQRLFEHTRWCIIDEIHAVASTKRGAHLALTLERLSEVAARGGDRSDTRSGPATDRSERDPEPARGGRPFHGRPRPQLPDRRRRRAQGARPEDPASGGVAGRAR